jgi:hypothetical protein
VEPYLFLDYPPRILRWLHVEASKEPPISNSKISAFIYVGIYVSLVGIGASVQVGRENRSLESNRD